MFVLFLMSVENVTAKVFSKFAETRCSSTWDATPTDCASNPPNVNAVTISFRFKPSSKTNSKYVT